MLAKLILWAIDNAHFSKEERALFTGALLSKLGAIDPRAIIEIDKDTVLIRGVPLDGESMAQLRESAKGAVNSFARKVVRDVVLQEAYNIGLVTGKDMEQVLFSRSAVWFSRREEELYKDLAKDAGNSLL